ncbi:MAG: hypothetical protein AABW82_03065 [Nanoarchaeota archaeon]
MELKELKNLYSGYEKKYKLPGFDKLNEQFEIEKIDRESGILMRVIRKIMMDKVVNSLAFLDMIANPMNAPRIYLSFIKSISEKDKEVMEKLYDTFGNLSLSCLALELDYSEKKEAEMVKSIYEQWEKARPEFSDLLKRVHKPLKNDVKKEKSYFG